MNSKVYFYGLMPCSTRQTQNLKVLILCSHPGIIPTQVNWHFAWTKWVTLQEFRHETLSVYCNIPPQTTSKTVCWMTEEAAQHICGCWNSASRAISIVFLQNGARNVLWEAIKAKAQGRDNSASKGASLSKFYFNIFGDNIKF